MTEVTTDIPRSRSIAIQSERVVPPVALGFDLPGKLNCPAKKQELLRQGGLAGIWMGEMIAKL